MLRIDLPTGHGQEPFKNSPNAGHPQCLCSKCGNLIDEDEGPIRCWSEKFDIEYRWHHECFQELIKEGIIIF